MIHRAEVGIEPRSLAPESETLSLGHPPPVKKKKIGIIVSHGFQTRSNTNMSTCRQAHTIYVLCFREKLTGALAENQLGTFFVENVSFFH